VTTARAAALASARRASETGSVSIAETEAQLATGYAVLDLADAIREVGRVLASEPGGSDRG
jgi:hypothetical protein